MAALASPNAAHAADEALWSKSDRGEDVASLSYERALRTHARYRPPQAGSGLATPGNRIEDEDSSAAANATAGIRPDAPELSIGIGPDRDLRSTSVTIRLSKPECERLRARAAEAQLTISAYLRSCALEAEALRAEVKKALAELKAAAETANTPLAARKSRFGWMGRFIPR